MLLKSFIAIGVIASSLTMTTTKAVAEQPAAKKPDIAEMLKRKMLRQPIRNRRFARKVYGRARISREVQADLVVLSVGIKANGDNAGQSVSALEAKKKAVITAIETSGFKVSKSEVSGLRVFNRRRTQYVDGQRKTVRTFEGTMNIEFTFKASDNVLADVAKITGDRVTGINSLLFKFSTQAWNNITTELKAQALDKATQSAKAKAKRSNRTLGTLMAKTVNDPHNRGLRGSRKRTMLLQVNARVTYQVQ